jgi:hypothetical protein
MENENKKPEESKEPCTTVRNPKDTDMKKIEKLEPLNI